MVNLGSGKILAMLWGVVGPGRDLAVLEIHKLVEESMGRFALAGRLQIDGHHLILHGHGVPAQVEIESLIEQWPSLSIDSKHKRCQDIVRRLQQQRHGIVSFAPPPAKPAASVVPKILLAIGLLLSAGLAFWFTQRKVSPMAGLSAAGQAATTLAPTELTAESAAQALAPTDDTQQGAADYEVERQARGLRVCRATQSRIMRGATVGPTDVEGWVVELIVFAHGNQDWTSAPELSQFVAKKGVDPWRVAWATAPDLSTLEGLGTEVLITPLALGSQSAQYSGLTLTFRGRYVVPYFREDQRINFIRLANALSDALEAEQGALFARCDGERSHHMGAWFRGPSPAKAAAMLMFAMSGHAEVPHLQAAVLSADQDGSFDPGYAWDQLSKLTSPLKRPRIATVVGSQGGMIAGRGEATTNLTFPFRDANRAERSSLLLAQELEIAVQR
jgi:serine/threonine-protein kinase